MNLRQISKKFYIFSSILVAAACLYLLFSPSSTNAAEVDCHQKTVTLNEGDYCDVSTDQIYYFAYTSAGRYEAKVTVDHNDEDAQILEGSNAVFGCARTTAAPKESAEFRVLDGTMQVTGSFDGCGSSPPPPPPGPAPTGTLTCTVLNDTTIRWSASWRAATARVVLVRSGDILHTFRRTTDPPRGSGTWDETGLTPGVLYRGNLRHAPTGSNQGLDSASCTTPGGPGPRIPYLSTVFNNIKTYGDIHAGSLYNADPISPGCQDAIIPEANTRVINGAAGLSAVSSVASATNRISGFGSGSQAGLRDLLVGNTPNTGFYHFPICRPNLRSNIEYYRTKQPRQRHRAERTIDGKKVIYYGTRDGGDDNSCSSNDVPRIIAELQAEPATPEEQVLIWCDVRWTERYEGLGSANGCVIRSCNGFERKNRILRLNQPITIKGNKTLYVRTWKRMFYAGCTPTRFSCPGPNVRVSINDRNYAVRINQNIFYDPAAKSSPRHLPSFALVSDVNIRIHGRVTELFGYYFAGALRRRSVGNILTCHVNPGRSAANTASCNNPLTVNGMLSGKRVTLRRTGDGQSASGPVLAERVGGPAYAQMFVGIPPILFTSRGTGSSFGDQHYFETERPPIF